MVATNELDISINTMIEEILNSLELKYDYYNKKQNSTDFHLSFIKPMPHGEEIRYNLIIHFNKNVQSISVQVYEIEDLIIPFVTDRFSSLLNLLNASTIYGNVFYNYGENDDIHIGFRHAFFVLKSYDYLFENILAILDYIDFFILEIKNVLSEDLDFEF